MPTPACDLSVVIPCYRDAPHLLQGYTDVVRTLSATKLDWEIVFVNDASPDSCAQIIDDIVHQAPQGSVRALHHTTNTGRGKAVMDGFEMARGKVVGFIDIDLEVHSRYIPSLYQTIADGADVASAYRVYRVRPGVVTRAILSKGYLKIVNALLGLRMKDTEAGYKFIHRERAMPILRTVEDPGWFWDTEMMARCDVAGLRIAFVPALFLRRPDKATTVRLFSDSIIYLKKLFAFRRTLRKLRSTPTDPLVIQA